MHTFAQHTFTNHIQSQYSGILRRNKNLDHSNLRLVFIFLNGSIIHNQTSVYFQCLIPTLMRVPKNCSFKTLNSRIHNTLRLINNQFVDEIYYQQSSIDVGQQYFFHSLQLKNDDDVCTMLMCNEQYSCVGSIKLLCIISRTPDGILNLLRSTISHIHDAMLYYNDK